MSEAVPQQPITRTDPAWRSLKLWLSVEIRKAQRQLEQPGLTPQEYDIERGRIAAHKALIRAVEPERPPEDEKVDREGRNYLGAGEDFDYNV